MMQNRKNEDKKKPEALGGNSDSFHKKTIYDRVSKFSELRKQTRDFTDYLYNQSDLHVAYKADGDFDIVTHFKQKRYLQFANKLSQCSNYLKFRNYYEVEQVKLVEMYSCQQHWLCPFCASARATKMVQRYHERLEFILNTKGKKRYEVAFITLTVKNSKNLKEVWQHMISSFKTYQMRRKDWIRGKGSFNEFCKIDGCVYTYEITYNKDTGEFHPHIHIIAVIDSYIEFTALSDEWFDITGDSFVVDVRKVRKENGNYNKSFCELFKYALKFSSMPYDVIWDIHEILAPNRKPRISGSFGSFYGVKIPETDTDELEDYLEDEAYFELLYQFCKINGYNLIDLKINP